MTQFTKSPATNAAQQDVDNLLMIKLPVMQPLHAPLLHQPLIAPQPLLEPTSQSFINWALGILSKLRMPYDPVPVWLPQNAQPAQQPQDAQPVYKELLRHSPEEFEQMRQAAAAAAKALVINDSKIQVTRATTNTP